MPIQMMDPSFLLRTQQVQLPNPLELAQQQMTLGQLARAAEFDKYRMEKVKREDAAAVGVADALGNIQDWTNDQEVLGVARGLPPEARRPFLEFATNQRKAIAEEQGKRAGIRKDEAAARKSEFDLQEGRGGMFAGEAYNLAQQPELPRAWVASFANRLRGTPFEGSLSPEALNDPEIARRELGAFASRYNPVKEQVTQGMTADRDAWTRTYQQGQLDATAARDAANQRHQGVTEQQGWARINNERTSSGRTATDAAGRRIIDLREKVNNLDEEKNYRAALPILRSIRNAPDTAAGDLDLIYGVGKILDPGSVVREGEMVMVTNAQSPLVRLLGTSRWALGNGRLPPQVRAQMIEMLSGRVDQLSNARNSALAPYRTQIEAEGLPSDQIFTDLSERPAGKSGGQGQGQQRQGGSVQVGQGFDQLPPASSMPGVTMRDPSGARIRSDGTRWVFVR